MTIDAKKQNDKPKTDKQNSDISEDGTEILEEPKKNKKDVVATELASEQIYNFVENVHQAWTLSIVDSIRGLEI